MATLDRHPAANVAAEVERFGSFVAVDADHPHVSLNDAARYVAALSAAVEDGRVAWLRIKFAGIQEFLYTVGSKRALKVLRGRSAYVDLFTSVMAHEASLAGGMNSWGVLFVGGGKADILVPPSRLDSALAVIADADRYLESRFGPVVSLIAASVVADMTLDVDAQLALSLQDAKSAPHESSLRAILWDSARLPDAAPCALCHRDVPCQVREPVAQDDEPVSECDSCFELERLGQRLPTLRALVRSERGDVNFGVAQYRFASSLDAPSEQDYSVNAFRGPARRFWFAQTRTPGAAELQACSAHAPGGYIAVLRADVDNLGSTFANVRRAHGRLAAITLSSLLTLFFRWFANAFPGEASSFVYSGGDDMFLVGAWDEVFETALRFRASLRGYLAGQIDLSAGMTLTKPEVPIYRLATLAGEMEHQAKKVQGKGSLAVAIGTKARKWEQWTEIRRLADEMVGGQSRDANAGKRFAYTLIGAGRRFEKERSRLPFPALAYALSKNRAVSDTLATALLKPDNGSVLLPLGTLLALQLRTNALDDEEQYETA
jgi:CRISPR-associated protein Csm1